MESYSLLPSHYIKLEPASETNGNDSSAKQIVTEMKVHDKMESNIPASLKIEQPEVSVSYPVQGIMESDSLLQSSKIKLESCFEERPSNNIKLEPVPKIDCAHSSTKEILTEIPVFDQMDSKSPANVKIEEPEVYIEYPGQEMHPSSESYQSISIQEHSQMEMNGNIEVVKQELPETLCEDRSQRFSKMINMTGCDIIQGMTGNSKTESVLTENGYMTSLNQDNCCHVSENMSSVIEISEKLFLTNEDCQLHNVHTLVKHTQASMNPLGYSLGFASCNPQRIQIDGAQHISDVDDPGANVNRHNRTHIAEKPSKSNYCSASFTQVGNIKCHKRSHIREKHYKCDKCDASYTVANSLKYHIRTHMGEKPYKCDDCGASFASGGNLKCHERTHTGEKPYKCSNCGASFTKVSSLKRHERTHTGDTFYKCDECDASFSDASRLNYHIRTHMGEKPYKCDDCGASFARVGSLKRHERTHTGEKPYKCDECDASFSDTSSLKYHIRTHSGEKPYNCFNCGASFRTVSNLKRHDRTHTGEKPYKCVDCGASFTEASNLKRHERTHTGEKPYKCDYCGTSFASGGSLKCHERTHTGERPYKCDYCDASFIEVSGLKRHERTHTGEKPYKCDQCGSSFTDSSSLRRHEKSHTEEKPYECGAAFTQSGGFICHTRTHTKIEDLTSVINVVHLLL